MKEFDLEAAKKGAPVCTQRGMKARIVCFDKTGSDFPILALVEMNPGAEDVLHYTAKGRYFNSGKSTDMDLMMRGDKHTGWINIYREIIGYSCSRLYCSEDEALERAYGCLNYVGTKKIEWED